MIDNKRIAKNTLAMYFRMFIFMGIGFYTSRIILNTLGVEDYGINNVVGGIVAMMTFFNGALLSATYRNITYELATNDLGKIKKVFGASLSAHIMLALLIFVISETIGLWLFYNKMQIPAERMNAAFFVYHFSVISTMLSVTIIPYNALIVAHERMSAFAWMSILDAILKLAIVYLLVIIPFDKLIIYSFLFFIVSLVDQIIFVIYAFRNFPESKTFCVFDKELLSQALSFTGWSMFGNLAGTLYTQGLNILLNVFFGPVVNAAYGISVQVQGQVQKFIGNFQSALNPQIIKTYAAGDLDDMHKLMYRSARFSFFLMLILTMPIMLETNYILTLWLKIVPENTVIFFRIIMCSTLIYTVANPMIVANQATGQIKKYQIVCGCILLSIVPISYILLKIGFPAYSVFIVHFFVELICQYARMHMLKGQISISLSSCFTNIYKPILLVVLFSSVLPLIPFFLLEESFIRLLLTGVTSVLSTCLSIYCYGLSEREKEFLKSKLKRYLNNN